MYNGWVTIISKQDKMAFNNIHIPISYTGKYTVFKTSIVMSHKFQSLQKIFDETWQSQINSTTINTSTKTITQTIHQTWDQQM